VGANDGDILVEPPALVAGFLGCRIAQQFEIGDRNTPGLDQRQNMHVAVGRMIGMDRADIGDVVIWKAVLQLLHGQFGQGAQVEVVPGILACSIGADHDAEKRGFAAGTIDQPVGLGFAQGLAVMAKQCPGQVFAVAVAAVRDIADRGFGGLADPGAAGDPDNSHLAGINLLLLVEIGKPGFGDVDELGDLRALVQDAVAGVFGGLLADAGHVRRRDGVREDIAGQVAGLIGVVGDLDQKR
jgi:hypothetical protein